MQCPKNSLCRLALIVLAVALFQAGCDQRRASPQDGGVIIVDYSERDLSIPPERVIFKVGFIHSEELSESGWVGAHERARLALDALPSVETAVKANVPETRAVLEAVDELVQQGCSLIVGTAYAYGDYLVEAAEKYPKVNFLHCAGYKTQPNLAVYFGRMYEARYLTGMVAGLMTYSNIIGYVASMPVPEVMRGINAFALGVQEVNPTAQVRVAWTNAWNSPELERSTAEALIGVGADVIAQHQNSPAAQQAAEEHKVFSIGYHTDLTRYAPYAHVTAAVWTWEAFYRDVIKQIRDGAWEGGVHWPGMREGVVDISPFSPDVPEAIRNRVLERRQEIIDGSFVVFQGPVRDQNNKERIAAGRLPDDRDLLGMTWLVEGVMGAPE